MININFSSFGADLEPTECTMEVTLGNQIVRKQTLEMPYAMLESQCRGLVKQIANDFRPMKIKFSTKQYMEESNLWKDAYLAFSNNAYLNEFPDEKDGE